MTGTVVFFRGRCPCGGLAELAPASAFCAVCRAARMKKERRRLVRLATRALVEEIDAGGDVVDDETWKRIRERSRVLRGALGG